MFAAAPARRRGWRVRARLGIGIAVLALLFGSGHGQHTVQPLAPVPTAAVAQAGVSTEASAATVVDAPADPPPVAAQRRATEPVPAAPVAARGAERSAAAGRAPPLSR